MEASFQISRAFLRKSHAKRLFKRWWLILIAVLLICPSIIGDLKEGTLSGVSIFALSAVAILVLRFGVNWIRTIRFIDNWVQQQGDKPIAYNFETEEITAESAMGKTQLKWKAFKRLTVTDFHILLELQNSPGSLTLPTAQASPELIGYLRDRFQANALPIRG